jgi:hypothetical protein
VAPDESHDDAASNLLKAARLGELQQGQAAAAESDTKRILRESELRGIEFTLLDCIATDRCGARHCVNPCNGQHRERG